MLQFKKIAIISKRNADNLIPLVYQLIKYLTELGCTIFTENNVLDTPVSKECYCGEVAEWATKVDLAIVIGGDGTMLAAAREMVNYAVPLLGVNQGRLGFMTDVAASAMLSTINEMLIKANYVEELRSLLAIQVFSKDKLLHQALALNDVVISRGAAGSMMEFAISIDNEFVQIQKSDGVIIATPTGSTAYSLAAGGPILQPQSKVFSIVPICPQSMSNRPLVVSDEVSIEINLHCNNLSMVHFDGQAHIELHGDERIVISKAKRQLKLLHPQDYNYYSMLRTKLHWAKQVS